MYQFSGKIKTLSIALIIIGALGIAYSFFSAPSTVAEAKEIIASQHNEHNTATSPHQTKEMATDSDSSAKTSEAHESDEHAEHVLQQLQNKPWSAFYVSLFFFFGITLLTLAFYAAQRASQTGWSIVLFRVMESISANLVPTSIILFVFIMASATHWNHIFPWMAEGTFDPTSPNYDALIDGKSWWLNIPGWVIRSVFYLVGWNAYLYYIRKNSIAEDSATDTKIYKKSFNASVIFLVFFMFTESMMSWDWIMGIDPHWFSTLFGWYILASLLVTSLVVIAFVTIYLASQGYLPFVNDSHLHDLAKYIFGFSIFWAYLWFAQFLLIWYADMTEETVYFIARFNDYKVPFLLMVVLNFVFPILILMHSDFKRKPWFILIGGLIVLVGHYIDVFVMIMPGTVGDQWFFGIPELSAFLFFLGIFIYTVFSSFAKAAPLAKGNPFVHESEHYQY